MGPIVSQPILDISAADILTSDLLFIHSFHIATGLRSRSGLASNSNGTASIAASSSSSTTSPTGSNDVRAGAKADEPRPRNNGRRDLFGVRSSLVVLAVLAISSSVV